MFARAALDDLGRQAAAAAIVVEEDLYLALLPLLQVAHDAAPRAGAACGKGPFVVRRIVRLEAEDLDARPRRLVHHDACPYDLRVVEYDERIVRQLFAYMAEAALRDVPVAVYEQFRVTAVVEREFGYSLVGKRVVEPVYVDVAFHVFGFWRQSYEITA